MSTTVGTDWKGQTVAGYMRETIVDINTDRILIRHEVTDGKSQWGVDQKLSSQYTEKMLADARNVAVTKLNEMLMENGIVAISAPPNYGQESKHVRFA